MNDSPAVILFDSNGNEVTVVNGVIIPVNAKGILVAGSDGTNTRFLSVNSSGNLIVAGIGTAGTPSGGILTIQGVSSGTPIPVSGSFTATNPSVSTIGLAAPASATMVGGYDGANLRSIKVASDGTIRIDPTGTTTQPVSGIITANAGTGNFTVTQATAANLNATVIGTVTSNIGTTNGLALDATVLKLSIAQNAILGSNTQILIGGSVSTSAPAYTSGNINPLSLSTTGSLRVDGSGSTQPVSGSVIQIPSAPVIQKQFDLIAGSPAGSINYIGYAIVGAALSSSVWTINQISFDAAGNPAASLWSGTTAIWNNRTSTIYN